MKQHLPKIFLLISLLILAVVLFSAIKAKPTASTEEPAPAFSLPVVGDGQTVSLNDYSGKIVLVNFWATWCAPCLAEMPALEKLYQKLGGEEFEILAISVDEPGAEDKILSIIRENSLSFPVLHDSGSDVYLSYGVKGVPETFIVGRDGNLLKIYDFKEEKYSSRIIADREWASEEYLSEIERIIR